MLVPRASATDPPRTPVLLQLSAQLNGSQKQKQSDDALMIELEPVQEAFNCLDTHFTLPAFDLQPDSVAEVPWHSAAYEWLDLPWYANDLPCHALQVYFDGSSKTGSTKIGFAAVAFVKTDFGWMFAGATSGSQPKNSSGSYKAELCAAISAGKFAYDLLKGIKFTFGQVPHTTFLFDCVTVGKQMEGVWQAKTHKTFAHCLRSIVKLIETRFHIQPYYMHTPGHMGIPENKIADALADTATLGELLHDWGPFFAKSLSKDKNLATQWMWILFDDSWQRHLHADNLHFPTRPSSTPEVVHMRLPDTTMHHSKFHNITLKVATGNVLTLSS